MDDDLLMQQAVVFSLEKAGFRVTSVSTVEESVGELETGTFSAVLTDLYSPDGDALEVNNQASEKQPNAQVLTKSAYFNTQLGRKAKEIFGERMFEKPFRKKMLIMKIKELV